MSHSNLRTFMMSPKHVGALVHLDSGTNFKMYGEGKMATFNHHRYFVPFIYY